ncbi:MAG: transposase [Paracoccus sp. (in: a-proteobacteria)]
MSTKHRYEVLGGDIGTWCHELIRETARAHEMVTHTGSVNRDQYPSAGVGSADLSISRAVQYLKGRSLRKLLSEFGILRSVTGASTCGRGVIGSARAGT